MCTINPHHASAVKSETKCNLEESARTFNEQAITEKPTKAPGRLAQKCGLVLPKPALAPAGQDCFGTLFDVSTGQIHRLSKAVRIGRSSACDVLVDAPYVSRVHALLYTSNGKAFIADAGSKNGIAINGSTISGITELKDGDEIHLGIRCLIFSAVVKQQLDTSKPSSWLSRAVGLPASLMVR